MSAPQPDADGWIEHDGKSAPVGGQCRVSVRHRNDIYGKTKAAKFYDWSFRPDAPGYDIIAYRVVQP